MNTWGPFWVEVESDTELDYEVNLYNGSVPQIKF